MAAGMYSGPYRVVSRDTQRMVLEAYPGYWDGPPALDRVEVVEVEDPQARVAARSRASR
ncbi:MAG: ABC transporter substrate-binding protein [Egibacteraceae bacterium]